MQMAPEKVSAANTWLHRRLYATPVVSGFCQLHLKVHLRLQHNSCTSQWPDTNQGSVLMVSSCKGGLQQAELQIQFRP